MKRLKTFEIITNPAFGKLTFLTKAKNGKEALSCLLDHSYDFRNLVSSTDSNNMKIEVKWLKSK